MNICPSHGLVAPPFSLGVMVVRIQGEIICRGWWICCLNSGSPLLLLPVSLSSWEEKRKTILSSNPTPLTLLLPWKRRGGKHKCCQVFDSLWIQRINSRRPAVLMLPVNLSLLSNPRLSIWIAPPLLGFIAESKQGSVSLSHHSAGLASVLAAALHRCPTWNLTNQGLAGSSFFKLNGFPLQVSLFYCFSPPCCLMGYCVWIAPYLVCFLYSVGLQ